MRSMTGYGVGEAPLGTGRLVVEIRGVNHRYLDVRIRLARELADLSGYLEHLARERLRRGRFEVTGRVEGVVLGVSRIDRERARTAFHQLCALRDELAPGSEVPLSLLAMVPDLFVASTERELEAGRTALREAFANALGALDEMRAMEGQVLGDDLGERLENVRRLIALVATRVPSSIEAHRKRLGERIERLRASSEVELDGGRLEQEVALFAERIDISEELTRLDSHCAQFAALLGSSECIGRRLDFLLQEMSREANTAGAKSPDAQATHAIVEVKAEIERMREQVQNIE